MDDKLHTPNQPITLLQKNENKNKNKNSKTNREKAKKE